MMGIETIEAEEPRLAFVLTDEFDRFFRAPSRLVVLGSRSALDERAQVLPQ